MDKDLNVMDQIQQQKEKDIENSELIPLNEEGKKIAQGKRFTIDIIDAPSDPLR